jgi:hypothetical protein
MNEGNAAGVSYYMKDSPKLSAFARKRLVVVIVFSIVGVVALAATVPAMLLGPVGGALAGY